MAQLDPDTRRHLAAVGMGVARTTRMLSHGGDQAAVDDARRDYAAAKLAVYISRIVDGAPPLSPAQIDRLSLLLRGTG